MSLLDTIVSALRSLTGGTQSTDSVDTDTHRKGQVSVENDPDTDRTVADTSTEAAVKGTDPEGDTGGNGGDSDAVAAGTDAAASTGTLVDEDAGGEPAETVGQAGGVDADQTAAEIDDASADESDAVGEDGRDDAGEAGEADEAEDPAEAADDDSETAAAEVADGDSDEPVQTVKGIGPAYAERLDTVGIETVSELAAADAAAVADGIDVSESRVGGWIERARDAS